MWFKAEYTDDDIIHVDIESGDDPPSGMWRLWDGMIASVIYDIARHRQKAFEREGKDRDIGDEILKVLTGVSLALSESRQRDLEGEMTPLRPRLEVVDADE